MGLSASKCSQCHKKKQNLTATGVHVCVCGGFRVCLQASSCLHVIILCRVVGERACDGRTREFLAVKQDMWLHAPLGGLVARRLKCVTHVQTLLPVGLEPTTYGS